MSKIFFSLFFSILSSRVHAEVKNPGLFVYAITGDVDSLDPHWEYDGISLEVQYQLYDTLIFYAGSSVDIFEPMLSTLVPSRENGLISKDGRRYAFPLRKNVRFHDGTEMIPEDARYSLLRCMLMDRAGGSSNLTLEPVLGVENAAGPDGRPDPAVYRLAEKAVRIQGGALVLTLNKPYAPMLSILASYCPIVSKDYVIKNGGWDGRLETWPTHYNPSKSQSTLYDRANGTGPFKLSRWDKENKQVILARHEGYWRTPAKLQTVVFKTVNESNTRKLMLSAGDADAVMMEREFLPTVTGLPGVRIMDDLPLLEVPNVLMMNFKINATANPYIGSGRLDGKGIPIDFFADIDVRKGFAYSFDYDAYIRDAFRGKGRQARGPIPSVLFGYNPKQAIYSYDPIKAGDYFKKALGGKVWEQGFRFTVTYMEGRADRLLACQMIKKNVEALNPRFQIDIRGILWSTMLSAMNARQMPLVVHRWMFDYPDPINSVHAFLHSSGFYGRQQSYLNPRAERDIALAKRELDPAKRRALFYELQSIAYADVPQIYTVDTFHFQVLRSWVKGWYYNPILIYGYLYQVSKEEGGG